MNQSERRRYLIGALLEENGKYNRMRVPTEAGEQKMLLRSLMNVRFATPVTEEFAAIQDEYLKEANVEKGFITIEDMKESIEEICGLL